MENYKKEFIGFLVKSGAFKFGEFVTKSGRKTPYFINTGLFNSGELIAELGSYYAKAIVENNIKVDVLFGPAYKGIPLVVATAIQLKNLYKINVGFAFNRKEVKDHGEGGSIIGMKMENKKVLIIDDVITAGTSIRESLEILKNIEKVDIKGALISVDRKEKVGTDKFLSKSAADSLGISIRSIVSIDETIIFLYNNDVNGKRYIDDNQKAEIDRYRKAYGI